MVTYHDTDATGQAIVEARRALDQLGPALSDLDHELAEERHRHRVEALRLVERAEAAELAAQGWEQRADDTAKAATKEDEAARAQLVRSMFEPTDDVRVLPSWGEVFAAVREQARELTRAIAERRELAAKVEALNTADPTRASLMVTVRQQRERIELVEQHLAEERADRRAAEDRADDAERDARLANDRANDLDRQLAEAQARP